VSDEMRALLSGAYGEPPLPFAPEAAAHATEMPSEPDLDMDDLRSQAGGVGSEEDLLLLALFGDAAARLLDTLRGRGEEDVPGAAPAAAPEEPEVSSAIRLESPMVGTFYRSGSPSQPAFVDEGDRVEVGQTLCILEAMKLFNEFKAEHAGVIRKILVANAEPVEYGQPLFELEPA